MLNFLKLELEILSQHAISIREKIIHMIPLHYLWLNEEKYVPLTLSPLLPANILPLRISGLSLQDPTVPSLDNVE